MKKINYSYLALGALFIVVMIFGYLLIKSASDNNQPNTNLNSGISNNNTPLDSNINTNVNGANTEEIIITEPQENDLVTSPVTIRGQAKGSWFFEAVFPIQIVDGSDNQIGFGTARAADDWQTDEFVDFTAQITFDNKESKTGYLVLHNDNPSGLEKFAKEYRIPVRFSSAEKSEVKIYLGKIYGQQSDCGTVYSVNRTIDKTTAIATATINQLITGPTSEEKEKGYTTGINSLTQLNSLNIENGVARADFSKELNDVAGSCTVQMIRAQIENTLKQFTTIEEVIISVDGKTEGILQP